MHVNLLIRKYEYKTSLAVFTLWTDRDETLKVSLTTPQIIAETKLQKATAEAQRACKDLEDQMDQFEQKKVSDLKKILKEFIQVFKERFHLLNYDSLYKINTLGNPVYFVNTAQRTYITMTLLQEQHSRLYQMHKATFFSNSM